MSMAKKTFITQMRERNELRIDETGIRHCNLKVTWQYPADWLDAIEHYDNLWLQVKMRMAKDFCEQPTKARAMYDSKCRRLIDSITLVKEYWELTDHNIEQTVVHVWDEPSITLAQLKLALIGMKIDEWVREHAYQYITLPEEKE